MQERDTSGIITPPPSVNESEAQDITTGNQMREGFRAKNAIYMQQTKCSKTSDEESLLEIIKEKSRVDIDEENSFLLSLASSFKRLNDE